MKIPEKPEGEERTLPLPMLMMGEISQGFISAKALPPRIDEQLTNVMCSPLLLRDLL